jgi:hypothetical protein
MTPPAIDSGGCAPVSDSFRRSARILFLVLLAIVGVMIVRRLLASGRSTPGAGPAEHPIRLPDTSAGADIEVETVRGEHVVGGVETTAADEAATGGEEADESPVPWWVMPEGDSCPVSHPVKVKQSSGIYHVPGGINYDRTRPDRCYLSPAAAQNDGYRASKR